MELPAAHLESVRRMLGDEFPAWLNSFSTPPPTSIRVNPFKWKGKFPAERIPWTETGYYLPSRPSFTLDPVFHGGCYYVQEASSMSIEQVFNQNFADENLRVLDLCAAPGGKSTHILSLLNKNSLLVSNEVIRPRANILAENLAKWGRDQYAVTSADPEQFGNLPGFFDVILADLPCSGEGLFRREPDAVKEWSESSVQMCSSRQRRIVLDAWPALKKNGLFIYSTCTFNEKENEENLHWLKEKIGFESVAVQFPADWNVMETKSNGLYGYRFFPHRVKGEGFFFSVLRKTDDSSSTRGKLSQPLPIANNREKEQVKNFIRDPDTFNFYSHDGKIIVFRNSIANDLITVCRKLNTVTAGLPVVEVQKGLKPTHELALSVELNRTAFHETKLVKEDALKFLAKEDLKLAGEEKGISLVTFMDVPLGWLNLLGNRANNLYPKEWRIRHL
jgi:16S rRNA C967 or C1407 C5-methylase (RsmB/RsmF family)/NOL1/NOP2/fmu family ribosome biogenesis protein